MRLFNRFFPSCNAAPSKYRRKEHHQPNPDILEFPSLYSWTAPCSLVLAAGRSSPRPREDPEMWECRYCFAVFPVESVCLQNISEKL